MDGRSWWSAHGTWLVTIVSRPRDAQRSPSSGALRSIHDGKSFSNFCTAPEDVPVAGGGAAVGFGETTVGALGRAALLRGRSSPDFRVDGSRCLTILYI